MMLAAAALLPLVFTGYAVSRLEGAVLPLRCVVYLVWTVLVAIGHPMPAPFSRVALLGLLPATAFFLVGTAVAALRDPARRSRRCSRAGFSEGG